MTDHRLRELERRLAEDPGVRDDLFRAQVRAGEACLLEIGADWARSLSRKDRLLLAACGSAWGPHADWLNDRLEELGMERGRGLVLALAAAIEEARRICPDEWRGCELQAMGVVYVASLESDQQAGEGAHRQQTRVALGLERLPRGAGREENRIYGRIWRRTGGEL